MVKIIVNAAEANEVFDALIDTGKLDQPGKGFIYQQPVFHGFMNTLIFRGRQRHAASMEQVIQSIDEIKGDSQWRQRMQKSTLQAQPSRKYLSNSMVLIVTCTDGMAKHFIFAAMEAGAAGATICKSREVQPSCSDEEIKSFALEEAHIIVPESMAKKIFDALEKAGILDPANHGAILVKHVPRACTYLG